MFVFNNVNQAHSARELDSVYKHWSVYSVKGSKKICFIVSTPTKQVGNYRKRGQPFLIVTHIKKNVGEVSISSGYPYKTGSEVKVTLKGSSIKKSNKKYNLFTRGSRAWLYSSAKDVHSKDSEMIRQMKKGASLSIKGYSKLKSYSNDTYSLMGFTKAFRRMQKICK